MVIFKLIRKIKQFIDYKKRGIKVYGFWTATNIYPTAKIGNNVQIGWGCEIGNAVIGDNVRIGAFCFVPEGVTIESNVWLGPRCTFTNDKFPPSPKEAWEKTLVVKGARIGAGVTVICGNYIGAKALIGAGSVVTKNIPANETWIGVPAKKIAKREQTEGFHKNPTTKGG